MRQFDAEEAAELNAEQWQLDLLALNPGYVHWGPHEDYMWKEGNGWDSAQLFGSWSEFGPWTLGDLNECVNFYFSVERESKTCPTCGGNGYHPDAQEVANSFYSHMNAKGEHWHDNITQDEVQALYDAGRLRIDFPNGVPTADEVNAWEQGRGLGHDGINRWILTETRLKRLGIPVHCPDCTGSGFVYISPCAHATLTLWMLHPRKGCSRGVEVRLERSDVPPALTWLQEAAERNAQRFAAVITEDRTMRHEDMGGPAFPRAPFEFVDGRTGLDWSVTEQRGMTLWDYYAAAALQGLMSSRDNADLHPQAAAALAAYQADAMLAERQKRMEGGSDAS